MKKIITSIVALSLLSSCLRLDSNLFNASAVSEYKLEAYDGHKELTDLDSSYLIPDSLVRVFPIAVNNTENIYAIYVGNEDSIAVDTVILYCHGNRDHMDLYWNRAKLLANVGGKNRFGVLMMDYRGYGKSDGKATEANMYEDVDKCMQWLANHGLTNDRLIAYGYSLGSAAATQLTANPRSMTPSKLILESPFAGAEVMVQDAAHLGMPSSFFTDLKIDNAVQIRKVQQPFMWLHGEADDFLSVNTHGQFIFDNYNGTYKIGYRIPDAGHSNVPAIMGYAAYKQAVLNFITR